MQLRTIRSTILTSILLVSLLATPAHAAPLSDLLSAIQAQINNISSQMQGDALVGQVVSTADAEYRYRAIEGKTKVSMPRARDAGGNLSAHGFRFACVPSHFSYDDPVVYPGQEGRAHLHMFFGNTGVDYRSTSASIINSGASTCHGGTVNRSAYWVPAMINEAGDVVLPKRIFNYYKSWVSDRSRIQPIPAGLQILANDQILGSGGVAVARPGHPEDTWQSSIRVSDHDGLTIEVLFPDCVAVDGSGNPILTSPGGTSHVAYSTAGSNGNCPASHPYTIPQLTEIFTWDNVPYTSDWQLASDPSSAAKGTTAHADYMAGWTAEGARIMADCVRNGVHDCGPAWEGDDDMYYSPQGTLMYRDFELVSSVDATPLSAWPKSLGGGHSSHSASAPSVTTTNESPHTNQPVVTDDVEEEAEVSEAVTQRTEEEDEDEEDTSERETSSEDAATTNEVERNTVKEVREDTQTPKTHQASDTPTDNRVRTTENLNVRGTPGGALIAVVPKGSTGTVISGAVRQGDHEWVKVQFYNGTTGYVANTYIVTEFGNTTTAGNLSTEQRVAIIARIQALKELLATLQAMLAELRR